MKSGTSFFQNPQHVFLYLLTYILLAEWLFPLPYFTDTGYVHVFLLLTAFLFVVNAISMHFLLRLLFVTGAILYSMHTIFFQDVFLGISWWQTFLSMTFEQTLLIFTGDLYALNEMYRSFFVYDSFSTHELSHVLLGCLRQANDVFLYMFSYLCCCS